MSNQTIDYNLEELDALTSIMVALSVYGTLQISTRLSSRYLLRN